jgi:hypothetical protein
MGTLRYSPWQCQVSPSLSASPGLSYKEDGYDLMVLDMSLLDLLQMRLSVTTGSGMEGFSITEGPSE